MRTEKLSNGWDEVTRVQVRTLGFSKEFQPASHWVDFVKRHPQMNTRGRNHCERCKVRWSDVAPETRTFFVTTNKGNKVVCEKCHSEMFESALSLEVNNKKNGIIK